MTIENLIFVGLNGWAVALDRDTGEIVWSNDKMRTGDVTLLLDGDRLIVSTNGYLYCLDPLTGRIFWEQPLRGYRTGIAALCSVRGGSSDQTTIAQTHAADARRRAAANSSSASH
jgi:outer membrane protein assembly factor BamB